MRKQWLFIFALFCSSCYLHSCKKNMVEENYTPIVNPVIPDFTSRVNAGINGFITNETGDAVAGATITAGIITTTTDEFGYFKINDAAFAKSAGFIQVSKAGYFTGYRTFLPVAGKQSFIRLQLVPKTNAGSVDAVSGGTVSISGAVITLPANGIVTAAGNTVYTGPVNVAAHWFDPSDMQKTSLTMPGDLTGVDTAGHLNVLQTFGMLAVELTGSSGELLQIANGKKAALHFPLPSSLQAISPPDIPLWYFDETKGVWKQEGHAVKNNNSYDGEVSHFSYWNCDVGLAMVNFNAQVVDTTLSPLYNVPVTITVDGQINLSRVAYTDSNGQVNGWVPANKNLNIDIYAPCNLGVTAKAISVANEPIDLGTVKVDLKEYRAVLQGTITKCNGSPVTDGFVVMTGLSDNSVINVTNGVFSATGVYCPGVNAKFIAYDRETSQQSDVHNVQLVTGVNNVGSLSACSVASSHDSISYEFTSSSNPVTYKPPQYLFRGNFYFANDSTSINAIDLLNSNQQVIQFSFTGPAIPGVYPLSNNSIIINGVTCSFIQPTSVTVSSYGLIGQFITGSILGTANIGGSGPQVVVLNFHIQRDQ